LPVTRADQAGKGVLDGPRDVVLCSRIDGGDVADEREAEGEEREEGQETEVGDRRRELRSEDLAVAVERPGEVVEPRAAPTGPASAALRRCPAIDVRALSWT